MTGKSAAFLLATFFLLQRSMSAKREDEKSESGSEQEDIEFVLNSKESDSGNDGEDSGEAKRLGLSS